MNKNQKGFGIVEILLSLVVLGVLGFVIWTFYQKQNDGNSSSSNNSNGQAQPENQAPQINESKDLQKAENYLNNTDIDKKLDTTEIDNSLGE
ncbi:prepilin-type N-terminal cleavage/methylation domain-containing protein [Candidatus Parcubacteria bacterium]|nr:prepilin-type N-terminal cleavage/methylation domain-containing protein [Candidatus Parcubacteria bacterium]